MSEQESNICGACNGLGCIECGGSGRWYRRAPGTRPAPREPAAGATPAREETAQGCLSLPLPSELAATVSVLRSLIPFAARTENLNAAIDAVILAALRERDAAREDAALEAGDAWTPELLRRALARHHDDAAAADPVALWGAPCPLCVEVLRAAAAEGRAT